jgi:membrane-associated phospholipid phosphatase
VTAAPIRLLEQYPRAQRLVRRTALAWQTPPQRRLLLALGWALLAALTFARITEDYLTNDPLARWDVEYARWLAGERTPAGIDAFRVVTFFGGPTVVFVVGAVTSLLLYRRGLRRDAALIVLVLVGAQLLNLLLKLAFHRPRPEVAFVHLDTYSFPSGHAMMSAALYGTLAYLAWRHMRSRRRQSLLLLGTSALVALICFSRLYLGMHYLSDVLAGAAGGVFWLAVSVALLTRAQAAGRT